MLCTQRKRHWFTVTAYVIDGAELHTVYPPVRLTTLKRAIGLGH